MNVLVVNSQESVIAPLQIEVIKTLRGVYSADDIIGTFTNFFFARMIIDVTALDNPSDISVYQKLSIGLPVDKIILLIPASSQMANNYFLSKLISIGYYNFTTNGEGIMYLLSTPNSYKDVAHLHQVEMSPTVIQSSDGDYEVAGIRTLGVKSLTDGAGASSLIYMMKKELEEKYNLSVLALEVDRKDFTFFRDKNMVSTTKATVATELLRARNYNYIIVDLNDYSESICDDVIYLIEPSILKLNKLMLKDRNVFSKLKNKKVIINRSVLSKEDVKEFSKEAGIKIYYVIPPLNDREPSENINELLKMLGMITK